MKLHKEDKAGLYITVIIHLAVIIVLLISQIGSAVKGESSFLLDFTREEEIEKAKKEAEFRELISRRLDERINSPELRSRGEIRNIAVDASSLKDDRNTDAEQLYKDAERIASELKKGAEMQKEDADNYVDMDRTRETEKKEEKEYAGPSVVSYSLDGRKALSLSIPAYRCLGGGDVVVTITVDKAGRVMNAKVSDDFSSEDQCLRNYAVRAARLSRFSASQSAPDKQIGEIVYRFIAQ